MVLAFKFGAVSNTADMQGIQICAELLVFS